MAEFKVKFEGLNQNSEEFEAFAKELKEISSQVFLIKNNLSFQNVSALSNIQRRLDDAGNEVAGEFKALEQMAASLEEIRKKYLLCEFELLNGETDGLKRMWDFLKENFGEGFAILQKTVMDLKNFLMNHFSDDDFSFANAYIHRKIFGTDFTFDSKGRILDFSSDSKNKFSMTNDSMGYFTSGSIGLSLLRHKMGVSFGNLGLKTDVKVGNVSAGGKIGVALFDNGKLAPQLKAEVEAGVKAAEGEVELSYRNNYLKGKGELLGAKAEAKAGAGVITVEDNGVKKQAFGIQAKAGAEAYMARGEVTGGYKIFGLDISAKIGGKAGAIGAKAGGSISTKGFSFGASLSLLLGLDFELSVKF